MNALAFFRPIGRTVAIGLVVAGLVGMVILTRSGYSFRAWWGDGGIQLTPPLPPAPLLVPAPEPRTAGR